MYTLKKSLGQHFLHDENVCRKIIDQLAYPEGMNLLEIGPGGGALTKYLLEKKGVNYKAIEIDKEKVDFLNSTYPQIKGKIANEDILTAKAPFESPFTIIGNFPYNISSPIMFKALEWEPNVVEIIGMFQKEVGERIACGPGSKTYGILSVLMQAFFKVTTENFRDEVAEALRRVGRINTLARKIGVCPSTIVRWLRGQKEGPSLASIAKIRDFNRKSNLKEIDDQ